MIQADHESDFDLTKDNPYLALMGELLFDCKDFGQNWLRYNGTALH